MSEVTYKTVDLFGNEAINISQVKNKRQNLFAKYDDFVDKFEVKKTTDDCYTPKEVFSVILDYVSGFFDLSNKKIVRPFYPDGDYQSIDYTDEMIVIDNPPFSIITQICRYYIKHNVKFFLFAPHLTLFTSDLDLTHVVVSADIVYENGAVVKTSFLTNMMDGVKILGDAELHQKLKEVQKQRSIQKPKYDYPNNVLMVSKVAYMVEKGVSFRVSKNDAKHCKGLDDQKKHKKAMFGGGFLLSEKAAAEKAAAEKAAAEKAAAEKENVIIWQLSNREKSIINNLG